MLFLIGCVKSTNGTRKTEATENKNLIKIVSFEESVVLREGIAGFKQSHPEVEIEYEYIKTDDFKNQEDIIRNWTVELLAGFGADIYMTQFLPEEKYIENGVFDDLSDIIQPMIENDEILDSIARDSRKSDSEN